MEAWLSFAFDAAVLYCTALYHAVYVYLWVRVPVFARHLELVATLSPDQGRPESPSPTVARRDRWVQALEGRRVLKEANFVSVNPVHPTPAGSSLVSSM